jgi:hypothetical protein
MAVLDMPLRSDPGACRSRENVFDHRGPVPAVACMDGDWLSSVASSWPSMLDAGETGLRCR